MPAFGHMPQDPLRTGMANDLVGGIPSDLFRAGIPIGKAPLTVNEVNALSHVLEDLDIDLFLHAPQPPLDVLPPTRLELYALG